MKNEEYLAVYEKLCPTDKIAEDDARRADIIKEMRAIEASPDLKSARKIIEWWIEWPSIQAMDAWLRRAKNAIAEASGKPVRMPRKPINLKLIFDALDFAAVNHSLQKRKYTGEPYVNHLIAVAKTVAQHTEDYEAVMAAILHDIVEDTPVTEAEIKERYGARVHAMVVALTDSNVGNREARKLADRKRLAKASEEVQLIKLADLIDNMRTIYVHDEDFAVVFEREKDELLKVMTGGPTELRKQAMRPLHEKKKEEQLFPEPVLSE